MKQKFHIDAARGLYPIVYVRGFAGSAGAREETFYDTYYGFADTAVEKRNAKPPEFMEPIVFEGQLIRLLKEYGYIDAANGGLALALRNAGGTAVNPAQSLWISRFYDRDVMFDKLRTIEEHAEELRQLICDRIPAEFDRLPAARVDLGPDRQHYKVILIAHSMGGLVSRCLIQNTLPKLGQDPTRWIHRLVTVGTPHGGIELSAVPDFLEELGAGKGNIAGSAIFKETRMRNYLKLGKKTDVRSLNGTFPQGRCLCIIGSDHASYSAVRRATGGHSDGLVKQDRAYIKGAYWANVHRAHSGRRGILNSFESYENIRRFLFGDTRVRIWLENLTLELNKPPKNIKEFYDIEFSLSVRGTGIFLHQRKQDPCENAQRFERKAFPLAKVQLHTGFMDTRLRTNGSAHSHFLLAFRIAQHRVRDGFLFDHEYPERTIYSESLEVRVNLAKAGSTDGPSIHFRWLSETTNPEHESSWQVGKFIDGTLRLPLLHGSTVKGEVCIHPTAWPDETTEKTVVDASEE